MSNNILFVGTFLSKSRGSKAISETIAELLRLSGFNVILVSKFESKFIRLIDIVFNLIFRNIRVVHIDVFSGQAFIIAQVASWIARLKGRKLILTLHGGALIEFYLNNPKKVSKVLKRAGHIQSPSKFLLTYFNSIGYDVNYLPNPIDSSHFPYNRSSIKRHSMLWVRRFASIYNPIIPVLILSRLVSKYPDISLTMVGPDSGCLDECVNLAKKNNVLDRIEFTGSIENFKLYSFYQAHHVYLNTPSYESFGVALIEAASCGIPIVSNKVGELPFIWEDKLNILMVEDNNLDEFVSSICKLFDDDIFASSLSVQARSTAKEFNWENLKFKWVELLEK